MPWKSKVHKPWSPQMRKAAEKAKAREEYRTDPYAWMYNMTEWRCPRTGIRGQRLRLEPLCRICSHVHVRTVATEVDHITPHKGDMTLFLDLENTQSLCKSHHSRKTALEMKQ